VIIYIVFCIFVSVVYYLYYNKHDTIKNVLQFKIILRFFNTYQNSLGITAIGKLSLHQLHIANYATVHITLYLPNTYTTDEVFQTLTVDYYFVR